MLPRRCPTASSRAAFVAVFLSAIIGESLNITSETVESLSALCDEFGCAALSLDLSAFRSSADDRLAALTQRIAALAAEMHAMQPFLNGLQSEVSALRGGQEHNPWQ
jgi:hypothetical protein